LQWQIPVSSTLVVISYIIYTTYTRGLIMGHRVAILRFLSRLAMALALEDIDEARVMRWPRDAAREALSCLESLGAPWTLPSRCPGEGSVFGVSDAAGASDDGAWRGWAYAYHSPRYMRVRSGPISPLSKDIFREELGVCVSGRVKSTPWGDPLSIKLRGTVITYGVSTWSSGDGQLITEQTKT